MLNVSKENYLCLLRKLTYDAGMLTYNSKNPFCFSRVILPLVLRRNEGEIYFIYYLNRPRKISMSYVDVMCLWYFIPQRLLN